jgi:hypothetical protein
VPAFAVAGGDTPGDHHRADRAAQVTEPGVTMPGAGRRHVQGIDTDQAGKHLRGSGTDVTTRAGRNRRADVLGQGSSERAHTATVLSSNSYLKKPWTPKACTEVVAVLTPWQPELPQSPPNGSLFMAVGPGPESMLVSGWETHEAFDVAVREFAPIVQVQGGTFDEGACSAGTPVLPTGISRRTT